MQVPSDALHLHPPGLALVLHLPRCLRIPRRRLLHCRRLVRLIASGCVRLRLIACTCRCRLRRRRRVLCRPPHFNSRLSSGLPSGLPSHLSPTFHRLPPTFHRLLLACQVRLRPCLPSRLHPHQDHRHVWTHRGAARRPPRAFHDLPRNSMSSCLPPREPSTTFHDLLWPSTTFHDLPRPSMGSPPLSFTGGRDHPRPVWRRSGGLCAAPLRRGEISPPSLSASQDLPQ